MFSLLLAVIYISFISLGLPDSLLGSAWPVIYPQMGVPISYSGIIFFIISAGTVLSSLQSDRLTKKLGTGTVTAISVAMTAIALLAFSVSHSFILLCVWAIPYGLGAGSVDAALNNYVALHYKSRHMSWLHAMWGIGATLGPYIMSAAITHFDSWNKGYRIISVMQMVLSALIFLSLPLWKRKEDEQEDRSKLAKPIPLKEVIRFKGAKEVMIAFFCYCALESTVSLWASSFLVLERGIDKVIAAAYASLFFTGITAGRIISGFVSFKLNDLQMIRLGQGIILSGLLLVILPLPNFCALAGLLIIGLGCAPVYPSIIHSTPDHFGRDKSQAMVGVQMASAYTGTSLMPPVFGLIAQHLSLKLFPYYLFLILILMFVMHERLVKLTAKS